jgi:ornithine carbamoyltransferase
VVFDQAENRMHAQKAITLMLLGGAKRIPSNRNKGGLQARTKR